MSTYPFAAHTAVEVFALPTCDIHRFMRDDPNPPPAAFDGKTVQGPWANMCEDCFTAFGTGLGLGRGQRLILVSEAVQTLDSAS